MDVTRYRAAGGIVIEGDRLLLLRTTARGETVLPKGHVEPGETAEAAAVRETVEETGYAHPLLLADLGVLQAQFPFDGRWVIRDEQYFVMTLRDHERDDSRQHDDADYDRLTFERLWAPLAEAEGLMTYEPSRSFVRRAVAWWRGFMIP